MPPYQSLAQRFATGALLVLLGSIFLSMAIDRLRAIVVPLLVMATIAASVTVAWSRHRRQSGW